MLKIFQSETKKIDGSIKKVGRELLKIDISYPFFKTIGENDDKVGKINKFYEDIANNGRIYAEEELAAKICEEYENDPDPKKRFYFKKYIYKIEFDISEEKSGLLCVCVDCTLFRGTRKERFRRISQVWNDSSGHLVPPENKKGKAITSPDGYYLKNGHEVLYSHDGGYHEEEIKKQVKNT